VLKDKSVMDVADMLRLMDLFTKPGFLRLFSGVKMRKNSFSSLLLVRQR